MPPAAKAPGLAPPRESEGFEQTPRLQPKWLHKQGKCGTGRFWDGPTQLNSYPGRVLAIQPGEVGLSSCFQKREPGQAQGRDMTSLNLTKSSLSVCNSSYSPSPG